MICKKCITLKSKQRSSLVAQLAGDLTLSLQWLRFNLWPKNLYMFWRTPKKKKKKKKEVNKPKYQNRWHSNWPMMVACFSFPVLHHELIFPAILPAILRKNTDRCTQLSNLKVWEHPWPLGEAPGRCIVCDTAWCGDKLSAVTSPLVFVLLVLVPVFQLLKFTRIWNHDSFLPPTSLPILPTARGELTLGYPGLQVPSLPQECVLTHNLGWYLKPTPWPWGKGEDS